MPRDGMVETKKLAVTGSQIQGAQLDLPVLYQLNRNTGRLSAYTQFSTAQVVAIY